MFDSIKNFFSSVVTSIANFFSKEDAPIPSVETSESFTSSVKALFTKAIEWVKSLFESDEEIAKNDTVASEEPAATAEEVLEDEEPVVVTETEETSEA